MNMTMAPKLQGLLPDVLADYLDRLIAAQTEGLDGALMECRLEIGEMGGRPVQAVELFGKRHVVFGFPPVRCRLYALVSHGRCTLFLDDGM